MSVFVLALSGGSGEAAELAKLRTLPDRPVEVAEAGNVVWVRMEGTADDADRLVRLLPAAEIFDCLESDRLRPLGRRVPTKRLPKLSWSPLERSLALRLPRAELGDDVEGAVSLALVPSESVLEGETMLLASLDALVAFAESAPAHRLAPLTYVVNDRDEALLRGAPLPPLPGERYVLRQGVATPFGLTFSPPIAPLVVREWLGLGDGEAVGSGGRIAIFRRDASVGEIPESAFVPLRRASLRALRPDSP